MAGGSAHRGGTGWPPRLKGSGTSPLRSAVRLACLLALDLAGACAETRDGSSGTVMEDEMCVESMVRPPRLSSHDAVYVPSSRRVLLFGGDSAPFERDMMTPSVYLDDLWSYDARCGSFTLIPMPKKVGPGQRGAYAAALDSKRSRLLLFGGRTRDGGGYRLWNDVWALDLSSHLWSELTPKGARPQERQGHRVVYDAARDRLLSYGGNTGALFAEAVTSDVHELSFAGGPDGVWRRIAGAAPPARQDMAMALDEKRGLWVLFGGAISFTSYDSATWAFDLSDDTWSRIAISGERPSRRFWAEMIYDPGRDRMVLFGGHDDGPIGLINDTWSLSIDEGTWTRLSPGDSKPGIGGADLSSPERRSMQSLVGLPDRAWLFGGTSECGPIDDLWTLDLGAALSWRRLLKAQAGETCARRAAPGQTCPSACGPPL